MGAGAQKSGGAAALPAPPPPRSLKQPKEIIDELAILLSVIIGAPSKKSNWIYLD